ncbi:uncharacterized protein LOC143372408 [Andrena cerasifolii]|uniref:uncharacterized protein LOC143372408 n=1 Tax=Andrena cerasifolii TaxID=2819439 RepID=UPI004037C7D7
MAGGEIGRSLSQMLKQTSKLDVLALYDVAASNKTFSSIPPRFHSFSNGEPLNTNNSRMLTMLEKSRFGKDGQQSEALQEPVRCFSTRVSNITQNETEELVEALRHLPIAEECAVDHAAKTNKIVSQLQESSGPLSNHQQSGHVIEGMRREKLKLGEPDCGEDPPGWVEKSPCHPPKGPCKPMGPPGYPAKPRQEKKPFCVKCPPKKPCKTRKC